MTGFEPLLAQAVSGVAVPVFQTLWGSGGKILGMFGKTLDEKAKQAIFTASNQYAQKYIERHGILKVLGMREPVLLESVYTSVQFLDDWSIRSFESIETLEKVYRQGQQRSFQDKDCKKQEGLKVAHEKQYLMVLGSPGAGKSTFLRRMGLEALKGKKGKFKYACIPVFIELKTFKSGDINIENEIAEEFRICGFPSHDAFTAKALEQGKLLILLDGLDEVPTARMNEAIQQIQNFVDLYNKNRFIASCRVAAYRHNFRRFTDVAIAEFDDTQIENFITNWFSSSPDTGQDCWQKLNKEEYKAAKELTQTPLLLTLVCLLYQHSRKFPNNRSTLYERALRVLLEEWAAEKGIPHDELYKGLDTKRKEMMLSKIAHDAFQADRLFLPRREVTDQIEQILREMLPDERLINGKAVLKSIEVQHGLLVERAEEIYSFSHLTIQEYLTAQYIDDRRHVEKLVTEHLTDERWREVFLLVAGLMRGGADDLLLLMQKEAQNYINTPKLKALLHWTSEITKDSEVTIKPIAKRAIACAILCTCIRASDISRSIDNVISNIGNSIKLSIDKVFSKKSNRHNNNQWTLFEEIQKNMNNNIESVTQRVEINPVARSSISSLSIAENIAKKLDSNLNVNIVDIAIGLANAEATELAFLSANTQIIEEISKAKSGTIDIEKNIKSAFDIKNNIEREISSIQVQQNYIKKEINDQTGRLNKIQEKINQSQKTKEYSTDINKAHKEPEINRLEAEAWNIQVEIESLYQAIDFQQEIASLNAKVIEIDEELKSLQAKKRKMSIYKESLKSITRSIVDPTKQSIVYACDRAIASLDDLAKFKFIKSSELNQIIARLEAIKAMEINTNQRDTTRQVLSKNILPTYLDAFALNEELVNVSEKEADALKNYFYINCLILDCKQAAVLVSHNIWKTIEARMFSCSVD